MKMKMADVVILSSDEEEEDDRESGSLFQDFLAKVEPFVERDVVLLLSTKFDERVDIASSSSFRSLLRRKIRVVGSSDAYIHAGEICKALCGSKRKSLVKPQKCDATTSSSSDAKTQPLVERDGDSSKPGVTSTAGEFENGNKQHSSREAPMSLSQLQDIDDDIVIVELPSAADFSTQNCATPKPSCSAKQFKTKTANTKKVVTPSKRRKVIRRLEEKMKVVSEQIRILNRAELSLDEMGMSDSTYIKESRLKERFNKIWNKICTLQGKPPSTGRVVEKEIKCPSTGYPVIDEEVAKFMKKRKTFPDIFDVKEVINKTNRKHDLRISAPVLQELAEEVFTNIGNRLQRRRKIDFSNNFGCFLTDDYDAERDPAMHDPDLRKKLEKNHKKSKHALNKIFRKFVHYDRLKYSDGREGASPICSGDNRSDDEDEKPPHRGRKNAGRHLSSSSSDSELTEDLSQSSQSKEHGGHTDNNVTLLSHRARSKKKFAHSASDASDFESSSGKAQTGKRAGIKGHVSDSDLDKSSQEIASSSQPELTLATNCSESLDRNSENAQKEDDEEECDSNSSNESRSLLQFTTESTGKLTCKADENDHLTNDIKESESQSVIMVIDDADDNGKDGKDSAKSSAVKVKKLGSVKQSNEMGQRTTVETNGEVETKATSSEDEVKVSTPVKISSPLRCSLNIQPVPLPNKLNGALNSAKMSMERQNARGRKRPAKNDFIIYESPLKVFRKSTLTLLQKEEVNDKELDRSETDQRVSVNDQSSCNANQGRSGALEAPSTVLCTSQNSITNSSTQSPRKSLSLKRKPQTKEISDDSPVAIIILSDDDSD